MKKLLLLLFVCNFACANSIKELEHAIMKSDFNAVEQILSQDISISALEQAALINLASEIIRKRENKILIHEMNVISRKNSQLKYLQKNKELDAFKLKSFVPFGTTLLITIASLCVCATAHAPSTLERVSGSCAFTSFITCAITAVAGTYFLTRTKNKIIAKHKVLLSAQHKAAIKIKQLIFKIKVIPSGS